MEEHNRWESIHAVYSALFAIHQEQIRLGEEYELVLGLGLLTWKTPSGQRVCRHLIVGNALLEFEARLGKFTVRPMSDSADVRPELDMLDIEERPARAEETAKASLSVSADNPWEKDYVEGVLQALVHSIHSQGEYGDTLDKKGVRASDKPVVEYAPALILRKRSGKGLTEALKKIKDGIEQGGEIPPEFGDLAEIRPSRDQDSDNSLLDGSMELDGEVFFPKPSNEEQRRIVDKIRTASGVLVQGPPGTGKSHTIANLICHLLATGQRTLITAKTPRALQVLERLVHPELQPLCINLLGSGLEERMSLESSVGGILRKNGEWNEDRAEQERTDLEKQLRNLREDQAKVNRRLRDIRESETHTQSIADGTYKGTAARIVEAVNRDRRIYDWFTDAPALGNPCPVSATNLRRLLEELRHFTPEKRKELKFAWPGTLPAPERFARLIQGEKRATEEESISVNGADERIVDLLSKTNLSTIEATRDALSNFRDARRRFMASPHPWVRDALRDVLSGNSSLWRELFRATKGAADEIETLVAVADSTTLDFPDNAHIIALREDACKLKAHMENGGKLGWGPFRPKVVKECIHIVKTVRINGRPCSALDDFSTLADVLHARIECEKAWGFWVGRAEEPQGPYSLQLHELRARCDALKDALSLEELIGKCRATIRQYPVIAEPVWSDESQIDMLISSCCLAIARHHKRLATDEIQKIESPLSALTATSNAHPVTGELLQAVCDRDVDAYGRGVGTMQRLDTERQQLQKVDEYILKLNRHLPKLTHEMEQNPGDSSWDERVQHIQDAWHWAQARYWIEEHIRKEDIPALAQRVKQIEDEINATIAKLASLHAWSYCFSRLEEDHRRHMEAWQQSMRLLGKGTGKHAPRHRREAQQHLNKCREAVPAWVMPLHRVWDTVEPAPGMFDLIIIDEASQCGVEALPLFYLGKKVLIVGDDKQISPDAVGLPRDAVHRLMEEFLHDFEFKSSFDVESRLFDHGKLRYGTRRITLREHFRCMPEIIRFSNDLCYSDTPLIPLRQYGPDRLPPIEHFFVDGGYREGKNNRVVNKPEADAVVAKICEMCESEQYSGKTIGVVVLQGEAQGALIENQLLELLGAEEMEKRRLVCGNPYSFQGDERDVIILSMVAAANERIGPFTKAADERRFNVAASRARDQMILFHSVSSDDLSTSCLRRRLLDFFENTTPQEIAGIERDELERRASQDNRGVMTPPTPFDSWFEVDVALALLRKHFRVLLQHEVAGKRIDLVVEGGQARLAIECDGDRWYGAEQYEADMQRQRQLERCKWEFFRVSEAAFYSNEEDALTPLWRMLEERGIVPGGGATADKNRKPDKHNDDDNSGEADENGDEQEDQEPAHNNGAPNTQPRMHPEEVSSQEISDAIINALKNCPNHSCTLNSLTGRVLKKVGLLTRGKPRARFERRVNRIINALCEKDRIEKYKAKNERVRLLQKMA
jgi:very-short-patch-repair endonuclease